LIRSTDFSDIVDEMLRLVDALQHLEEHVKMCPANWTKGDDAINPTVEGVAKYFSTTIKRAENPTHGKSPDHRRSGLNHFGGILAPVGP
jgi:hypothetical protein